MEQFSFFTGIDVSKLWLDIAVFSPTNGLVYQTKINNNIKDIRCFFKALKKYLSVDVSEHLFCMEHTGKYGHTFLNASILEKAKVWVELPIQIKRSQGLVRGKTDKWDAIRIAQYAHRFADKAVFWKPADKSLQDIKDLQVKRSLLVKAHSQLIQEDKDDPLFKKPLLALKQAIQTIELKMEKLLEQNEITCHQYNLLKTVPGIGKQTAMALIIVTNGFTRLTESRKLSCYAGLAPFPYSSGSSIKGRTKVSKMGDMKLKVLLNLSAWNAIRSITAFKDYFKRKVSEGKHKMSVINAVRNKLLALALAVIKRNSPYEKNYTLSLIMP
ncbi:IS110 family transposase [Pedobacter kyungheensis]|uniref:IS110 family transposase n=1 Tax=Pedobacter kyungheensis TaxID=1069985 RepID=UPI000689E4B9|nr:IS110 family transposase [Pedobacter kyungheensis]